MFRAVFRSAVQPDGGIAFGSSALRFSSHRACFQQSRKFFRNARLRQRYARERPIQKPTSRQATMAGLLMLAPGLALSDAVAATNHFRDSALLPDLGLHYWFHWYWLGKVTRLVIPAAAMTQSALFALRVSTSLTLTVLPLIVRKNWPVFDWRDRTHKLPCELERAPFSPIKDFLLDASW